MKKLCRKPTDFPKEQHFAIITFDTIYIPGDERSRTHPGHGYPESTEITVHYEAYTDRQEWLKEINRLFTNNTLFKALVVNPTTIEAELRIKVVEAETLK